MGAGTSIFPAAAGSRRAAGAPRDGEIIESCRSAVLREDMHCNLSSRGIVKMPDIVLYAPLLRSLDLSKNELAEFPLSLLRLENMHSLKLSCNRMSKVAPPPRSGVLWRLTLLSLSSNRIARFEDVDVASVMPSLVNLDMAGNPLSFEERAGLGSGTSRLTSLGLGGGAIACSEAGQALSRAVSCLSNLVELRLDGHGLGQAPWFDALELMSRGRGGEVKEGEGGHADGGKAEGPSPLKKIMGDEGGDGHGGHLNNVESKAGESEAGEVIGKEEKERKAEVKDEGPDTCAEGSAIRDAENVSAHAGGAEDEKGERAHVMAGLAARCLGPLFNDMAQLASLDLRSNGLSSLPRVLCDLTSLTRIDLSSNCLSQVPEAVLAHTGTLQHLAMSNNLLKTWPYGLSHLTKLSSLDLSWNELSSLPGGGAGLDGAWTDGELNSLTALTLLDISSNTIKDIRPALGCPSIRDIRFKGNPVVAPSSEECELGLEELRKRVIADAREERLIFEKAKAEEEERELMRAEAEKIRREIENQRRINAVMSDLKLMMGEMDEEEAAD